jgi:hypothetical protein
VNELFNWYYQLENGELYVCGDVCLVKLRHAEYIREKLQGQDALSIRKADKRAPGSRRWTVFKRFACRASHVDSDWHVEMKQPPSAAMLRERAQSRNMNAEAAQNDACYRFTLVNQDKFFQNRADQVRLMSMMHQKTEASAHE